MIDIARQFFSRWTVVVTFLFAVVGVGITLFRDFLRVRAYLATAPEPVVTAAMIAVFLLLALAAAELFFVHLLRDDGALDRLRAGISWHLAFGHCYVYVTEFHFWPEKIQDQDAIERYERWLVQRMKKHTLKMTIIVDDTYLATSHLSALHKFINSLADERRCKAIALGSTTNPNPGDRRMRRINKAFRYDVVLICRQKDQDKLKPLEAFIILPSVGILTSTDASPLTDVAVLSTTNARYLETLKEIVDEAIEGAAPIPKLRDDSHTG